MYSDIKKEFPIFHNNPGLIYLDSAATLQKPQHVIDRVSDFLSKDYANIHRGWYSLSERSEELYWQARKKVAQFINAEDDEVIFTSNSTDSVNVLVWSLIRSNTIKEGDVILLSTLEHHANLLPRQMLAEQTGAILERIDIGDDGKLDVERCKKMIHEKTKIVALTLCSNVTGMLWLDEIKKLVDHKHVKIKHKKIPSPESEVGSLKSEVSFPYIVVDGSQAIVHKRVDVKKLGVDVCFFTGHKLGAHTGIGVLRGKKELLKSLTPGRVGGGAIEKVTRESSTYLGSPDTFEPGTPNLVGAVSLLGALEYLEGVGSGSIDAAYSKLEEIEGPLISYCLKEFGELEKQGKIYLLGSKDESNRIGLFSFVTKEIGGLSLGSFGQTFATKDICIRCGAQCAHIFHEGISGESGASTKTGNIGQSCRISLWAYNEMSDLEKFFEELKEIL